jgi:hypothetical protein
MISVHCRLDRILESAAGVYAVSFVSSFNVIVVMLAVSML